MRLRPASQRSIRRFLTSGDEWNEDGDAFLFTRDLPLGVMPIGGQQSRPEYDVRLEPANDRLALLLVEGLSLGRAIGHGRAAELPDVVADFVGMATQFLAYFGEVYFELVRLEVVVGGPADVSEQDGEASSTEAGTAFPVLCALPPGRVRRFPSRYLQMIPKGDRELYGGRRFVALPSESVWHLMLPPALGSPRVHRQMLRHLRRLNGLTPEFAIKDGDVGRSVGYDAGINHAAAVLRREQLTRRWGRMPSVFQSDGPTEYHSLARVLQWQQSQATLREHLFAELNALFDRLGIQHRLVVTGLPSAQEIGYAMQQMRAGKMTVAEAMNVGRL